MVGKTFKYIKYPYAHFAAQTEFACAIARVTGRSRLWAFKRYTDIYGSLTDHHYADNNLYSWVPAALSEFESLVKSEKDVSLLSSKIYNLFLSTPFIYDNVASLSRPEPLRFGCFRLNNSDFYKNNSQVRLHFSPMRKGLMTVASSLQASDLSSVYLPQRKKEFSQMINFIYENPELFGYAEYFVSSTWMQNMPVYAAFFPENIERRQVNNAYLWLWGQFTKWDYSGNDKRLEGFRKDLTQAKDLKQVLNAIPLKVYEVLVPLTEMFQMYVPGYQSPALDLIDPRSLELDTNRPLRAHTAYLSKE